MDNPKAEKTNIQIIESILQNLARRREIDGSWIDNEKEDEEMESSVFKKAEALRCFLLSKQSKPQEFSNLPLSKSILIKDTIEVLSEIKRTGFYPSPYCYLPGAVDDQYTDFASFCLDFTELAYNTLKENADIVSLSKEVSKKALFFLLDDKIYEKDKDGIRWGGTSMFIRKKIVKEYFTDVYFTSQVLISLAKILNKSILNLKNDKKENIKRIINDGIQWIISRIGDNIIYGNEKKDDDTLIYTTWGLKAFVETFPFLEKEYIELIKPVVTEYVRNIEKTIEGKGIQIEQEYFSVLSYMNDGKSTSYDDRTGWAGVFLSLVSLKKIKELETLLEEINYYRVLERVFDGLLSLRNNTTKLWYNDYYILSIHHLIIESVLEFDNLIKDFSFELMLTPGMIRKAIKETLQEELTISTIQQNVYKKLQEYSKKSERTKIIHQQIDQFKV